MAFDTYRAVKNLEEVGFDEEAARVMVSMFSDAFNDNVATKTDIADMLTKADVVNMATKSDIAEMATKADIAEMATKSDVAELRSEFKSEIRELDARMTVRFVWVALGIVVVTTSLTSGIVGLLNLLQG